MGPQAEAGNITYSMRPHLGEGGGRVISPSYIPWIETQPLTICWLVIVFPSHVLPSALSKAPPIILFSTHGILPCIIAWLRWPWKWN